VRLPSFGQDRLRGEIEDRAELVPPGARAVGWFWLAGVPIGFVSGVMEFIRMLQGGDLSIALPAGVGLSGWAIGRGLLKGSRRAWRWARRIAALVMFGSVLGCAVVLFADPDTLTLDFPWGTHDADSKREAILLLGIMAFVGVWQFFSLNSEAARAAFDPAREEEVADHG
jgi:hypothetical protein